MPEKHTGVRRFDPGSICRKSVCKRHAPLWRQLHRLCSAGSSAGALAALPAQRQRPGHGPGRCWMLLSTSAVLRGFSGRASGFRSGRSRVDRTRWPPGSVGMGADLLASPGETASCGTTAINVPDAGWRRQRARPGIPTSAARPGAQTFRASGQAPGGLSVPRHSWDAWDRSWLPTEGARGGIGRRLPAAAPDNHACRTPSPSTGCFSAARRAAACAAPQLRSVLHASPVFLDTVPAKFRISGDIGAACIAAADGVVAWRQFLRLCAAPEMRHARIQTYSSTVQRSRRDESPRLLYVLVHRYPSQDTRMKRDHTNWRADERSLAELREVGSDS
jgi:hypothetical protein